MPQVVENPASLLRASFFKTLLHDHLTPVQRTYPIHVESVALEEMNLPPGAPTLTYAGVTVYFTEGHFTPDTLWIMVKLGWPAFLKSLGYPLVSSAYLPTPGLTTEIVFVPHHYNH